MMFLRTTLFGALLALTPVAGCAEAGPPVESVPGAKINGAEARRLVGAGAVLVDVRTPEEYADGHIEGARNLPLDRLDGELASLPKDKTIVVYCASGARSNAARQSLEAGGFDVRDLGRMSAW